MLVGNDMNEQNMLTPADAARYLGVERATMKTWRHRSTGPKFHRYSSRCIRYKRADLDAWIDEHRAAEEASDDS